MGPMDPLMSPAQVAGMLRVTPRTVARWADAGKLSFLRTPGGQRRYLRSEVWAVLSGLSPESGGSLLAPDGHEDVSLGRLRVASPPDGEVLSGPGLVVGIDREAAAAAVVAEAVAVALEEVAVESAEAVLVTAAAVTEAAELAADAAATAKGARAVAAEAAARSVTADAAKAASVVKVRAEGAARRVREAASLAAEDVRRDDAGMPAPEAARAARRLEATARVVAEAKSVETSVAAEAVRAADREAAVQVTRALVAAEEVIGREEIASAAARQDLASATAVMVARETDLRATGVEIAARGAALAQAPPCPMVHVDGVGQAPLTDPVGLRGAAERPHTPHALQSLLRAADERDLRAESRDQQQAQETGGAQSDLVTTEARDPREEHEAELHGGAFARQAARADRSAAASDRARLAEMVELGTETQSDRTGRSLFEVAELSQHLRAPLRSIISTVDVLESALRASDDRLRFLVDAVTDYSIVSLTPEGIIASWNIGATHLEGYAPDEAVGRHVSILYTAEDRQAGLPQSLLDRARDEGTSRSAGWRARKDGSLFYGEVVISAAHDSLGNPTGFVEVVRDLTEQHRLEAAQDSFYNLFEHDFRLPITAIKGFAELVLGADPADQERLLQRVDANADRLLQMATELVDHARLRCGMVSIDLQVVDLAQLVVRAVENLSSIPHASRIRVTVTTPVAVLTDAAALERVIANLISNALKYSPDDTTIHLTCDQRGGVGRLTVSDQGRGIDERDLGAIFLEFERGRLARDDSGTGLGLASVHKLVAMLRGTVEITSQVEIGTTVTVDLPLAP